MRIKLGPIIVFFIIYLFVWNLANAEEVSNADLLKEIKELKKEVAELKGDEPLYLGTYDPNYVPFDVEGMFENVKFCIRNKEKNHMHEWYKKKCS